MQPGGNVVPTDNNIGYVRMPCALKPESLLAYMVCSIARLREGLRSVTATPRIERLGYTVVMF